ncbi:MAG: 50S ribosomal protein L10 [Fusobacteria bacterium]|nr:50S ribosomal protein L10 [Fusobacteriota bacterium]
MANLKNQEAVQGLVEKIKASNSIAFINYQGITVNQANELRNLMRAENVEYIVAKNRFFKIALKEAGIEDNFDDVLEGTTAFAFASGNVEAPAKIAYNFGKDKKVFDLKAGLLDGKRLSLAEVTALAALPSKEVLLTQVLQGILGPIRKLAYGLVDLQSKKEA